MKKNTLIFLLSITYILSLCGLSNVNAQTTNCTGDYDIRIFHNGTNEYMINNCGIILQQGTYQVSDGVILNSALSMIQHGHISYGKGQYHFTNINMWLYPSITLIGNNWDSSSSDENTGTTFLLGNNASIIVNTEDYIKFIDIDCTTKTDSSECVYINPSSFAKLSDIYIWANPHNVGLHLGGTSSNSNGLVAVDYFDNIHISGGLWAVRMDHSTNNIFSDLEINGFKGLGLAIFNSDNNLFTKTMINGYGNSSNIDILFGSAANDGTGDNIFTQLGVSAGDVNFVSNAVFNSTNPKDIRPNHIDMVSIDGCINTVYNNHSQGQIDIENTAYPSCNGK